MRKTKKKKISFSDYEASQEWMKYYQELRDGKRQRVTMEWESDGKYFMCVIMHLHSPEK